MADADVGDDVYGEDPTVRRLEERTAELLGQEAALFVPTGSMGNQISLRVQGRSGSEVLLDSRCHIFHYEMAGMAALSGLLPRPVARGVHAREPLARGSGPKDVYYLPRTSMIALENTHNMAGGMVARRADLQPVLELAASRSIPVHLDGARLWNASAALGVPESVLARGLQLCDGLLLQGAARAGRERGRRVEGVRSGGAKGPEALRRGNATGRRACGRGARRARGRARRPEDHARAKKLAEGAGGIAGLSRRRESVETNIVIFS